MGMQDFWFLWVWRSCGDTQRIFCGYGMGMGIEIPSPRQAWLQPAGAEMAQVVRIQQR